jgi:hypothetical protein
VAERVAGAGLTWDPLDPPTVNVGARRGEGVHRGSNGRRDPEDHRELEDHRDPERQQTRDIQCNPSTHRVVGVREGKLGLEGERRECIHRALDLVPWRAFRWGV